MRTYPALTLSWTHPVGADHVELILARLDGAGATAIEELPDQGLRVFFTTPAERDRAARGFDSTDGLTVVASDVPDEDWGARSQAAIGPVQIGDLTVAPPWAVTADLQAHPDRLVVILPSMGFGTGHHASTRLCIEQLQGIPLHGLSVLDVGTGSGVLAIAAIRLGADAATGIDVDADALANAHENVELNHLHGRVTLQEVTLADAPASLGRSFDVILANLTGGHLMRDVQAFARLVAPGARLVASGFQTEESDEIVRAFETAGWTLRTASADGSWVAGTFEVRR
jgi:ribosomal protein L11 methyltransferase